MNEENQQQDQNQEQAPQVNAKEMMMNEVPSSDSKGPIIGAIIVVIILVIGGMYLWTARPDSSSQDSAEQILNAPDEILENLAEQGTSNIISDIEDDINNTNLDQLDSELENIQKELDEVL